MGCNISKASDPKGPKAEAVDTAPPPDKQVLAEDYKAAALAPNRAESTEEKQPEKAEEHPGLLNGAHAQGGDALAEASPVQGISHAASAPVIHDPESSPPAARPPAESAGDPEGATGKLDSQGRRRAPAATMPACFFKNGMHNGFRTVPEIPSMECPELWQAPHSLPIDCLDYEPSSEAVVTNFKNGDQERKIHNNIELSASEIERLQGMREESKATGQEFYPSVTAMATRFLSRARMDPRKAVKLMQETHDWRKDFFKDGPIPAESVNEDMAHGIVYFIGRDFALRPAIVIRANRIPQQWYKEKRIDKFIRMLIFCMEYFLRYMVVPGRVENLNVIVDLASLGISQVPLSALGEVYKVMSHHYIGRVYKFFVCNISLGLSTIAGMAKGFLTDRQKQKLNMLDDPTELRKEFALNQLETDLGGTRPKVTKFFPFPLAAGPFTAGYAGPSLTDSCPNGHELLSLSGAIGRLWDPKLTAEQNRRLEYTGHAAEILERCGLPVPPEARLDTQPSMAQLSTARSATASNVFVEGPDGKLHAAPEMTPSTEADTAETIYNGQQSHLTEEAGPLVDDRDFDLRTDEVGDLASSVAAHDQQGGGQGFFCCN
mmetsp:Transcript_110015/g.350392  ORF Transcript_110015/g.350392 Transcript_110015/m.350392 type:complete len:604 (+) Transcript_110015:90-1901(+)